MKTLKKIGALLVLVLSVSFVSCNDDDDKNKVIIPGPPTGTDIRYEVEASTSIIEKIRYKKGNGQFAFGHDSPDAINNWSMTIVIDFEDQPMLAAADVTFKNDSGVDQNYTLKIFEDGELVETQSGTLEPADAEITKNITYNVDNTP